MGVLTRVLSTVTANRPAQYGLEKTIKICLELMGVGAGTGAWASGERAMIGSALQGVEGVPCLFDVGANKGQFVSLLLDVLGSRNAQIHCFEPSSTAFETLQRTVAAEDRVRLNHFALGPAIGEGVLHFDQPGSGLASLTKRRLDHLSIPFEHQETVSIKTVDSYCAEFAIERIDLLKLDVEGHEMQVLNGANRMLSESRVQTVAFEFGGCNIDTRTYFQDFYYLFQELGMQIYRVSPSGYACPVTRYRELYEQFRTTNFYARRVA